MKSSSPLIKAESPERRRATECHILVGNNRREKKTEKLSMSEEKGMERGWRCERSSASSRHQMGAA